MGVDDRLGRSARLAPPFGAVFELTWSELVQLDAGGWYSPEFAGERIPDSKRSSMPLGMASSTKSTSRETSIVSRCVASEHFILVAVRRLRPNARIGIFEYAYPNWMPLSVDQQLTQAPQDR